MKEQEYKWMLTRESFRAVLQCVKAACFEEAKRCLQINYYYDTEQHSFDRRGITVRVRQIGDRLQGTVKRHGCGSLAQVSSESSWNLTQLPRRIALEGEWLTLQGQLVTERNEVLLSTGIRLCLDTNFYFGTTDYEMELEYEEGQEELAGAWKNSLDQYLGKLGPFRSRDADRVSRSKSQRFFAEKVRLGRWDGMGFGGGAMYDGFPVE